MRRRGGAGAMRLHTRRYQNRRGRFAIPRVMRRSPLDLACRALRAGGTSDQASAHRHGMQSDNPATRNRTRDHLIAAGFYSQMLYQLSYSRDGCYDNTVTIE